MVWSNGSPNRIRSTDDTNNYHLYLTNTDAEQLHAGDVTAIYALCWQVELLFKQLRQMGRIDHLPSTIEHIVKALIYGAVLALTLSNRLLEELRSRARNRVLPILRFFEIIRTYSHQLLLQVTAHRRKAPVDIFELLLHETRDPNLIGGRSSNILWEL